MVIQAEPIEFDDEDPRPLFAHLDRWAATELATAEQWADVLQRAGQWADYSPRNQVLLASYGVVGRVAGEATWAQVPSVEEGRSVAIRSGEHALKVRVPIVGDAAAIHSARSTRGGVSGSVASTFRWEPVFAAEQLARRPNPDAVSAVVIPAMSDAEWSETVRAASTAILGRRPRSAPNPGALLGELAATAPLGSNRPPLPARLRSRRAGSLLIGSAELTGRRPRSTRGVCRPGNGGGYSTTLDRHGAESLRRSPRCSVSISQRRRFRVGRLSTTGRSPRIVGTT